MSVGIVRVGVLVNERFYLGVASGYAGRRRATTGARSVG